MSGFETVSRPRQGTHHIWHMLPMDYQFPTPCGKNYYFGIGGLTWNHGGNWKMASCSPYSVMLFNVWNSQTGPGHVCISSSGDRRQIYEWQQLAQGCPHWFVFILVRWIYEMTIWLADTLLRRWSRAQEGVSKTTEAFTQLTASIEASSVQEWAAAEKVAMEQRGDALKIFESKRTNVGGWTCSLRYEILTNIVPTLADIRLKLSEQEVWHGNLSGTVTILSEGLAIERSQYVKGS